MFGYNMKTIYMNLVIFYLKFPPRFWQMKTSKNTFLQFFKFLFQFLAIYRHQEKRLFGVCPLDSEPINWISKKIFFESYGLDQVSLLNISPQLLSIIYWFLYFLWCWVFPCYLNFLARVKSGDFFCGTNSPFCPKKSWGNWSGELFGKFHKNRGQKYWNHQDFWGIRADF